MTRRLDLPARSKRVALKTAKGRSAASQRWLVRELNDPYVQAARAAGFRSRSAYKLIELQQRFHLIKKKSRILDLGAAPGGWAQAALSVGATAVIAVDLLPMAPIPGATLIIGDIRDGETIARVREALHGCADLVLSDMAPHTTGHAATDHTRIVALAECAVEVASLFLRPGGSLVVKVFQGGAEGTLLASLKRAFASIRHVKPAASRSESREMYLVAGGFRAPHREEPGRP